MAKIELEGHLRKAGDGYECSNLYLDGDALMKVIDLPAIVVWVGEGHNWIADFTEPEWLQERLKRVGLGYMSRIDLQADYGHVRITIEQVDAKEEP